MKKSTVIVLYGPIAVGKLTTGKILAEKLGYKLTHNHMINDTVRDMFDRISKEYALVVEKMRLMFYREIVKSGTDFITTHCYSHDFVSKATGVSDPEYLQKLKRMLVRAGARVFMVHLKADPFELLKRVENESRKSFRKLTSRKIMKELIAQGEDWETSAPVRGQLVIDNTHKSPEKVVEEIVKHFKLKKI